MKKKADYFEWRDVFVILIMDYVFVILFMVSWLLSNFERKRELMICTRCSKRNDEEELGYFVATKYVFKFQ